MYIKSVTAQAFGALFEQTLPLSPGLTVVHGDNETAKSTWHAAIYAALCGRRRGRGAMKLDDKEFAELRRPWHADGWKVRCEVVLDDGRTVTLQHDLDGKVDCRASDERGRDLSNEILFEGAPDGSKWLGLNRRTFAATACVNQAELLRVLDAAGDLQKDLQRAAATAGKDETAAAALDALKKYRAEHVGSDRSTSNRPLRRALQETEQARQSLTQAREAHDDYLRLVVELDQAQQVAAHAVEQSKAAQTALAAADQLAEAVHDLEVAEQTAAQARAVAAAHKSKAEGSSARGSRAHKLLATLPERPPPSALDDDDVAQQVWRALGAWESAPPVPHLSGETSSLLRGRLAALPEFPQGERLLDPDVERLRDDYLKAQAVLDASRRNAPSLPRVGAAALPTVGEYGADTVADSGRSVGPAPPWIALGGALLALGVLLLILGQPLAGSAALVAGAALGAARLLRRSTGSGISVRRHSSTGTGGATPDGSEQLASQARALAARETCERWLFGHEEAQSELAARAAAFADTLARRGYVDGDIIGAYSAYERACAANALQAREAEGRSILARQLEERIAAEQAANRAQQIRAASLAELRRVSSRAGVNTPDDTDELFRRLLEWIEQRRASREQLEDQWRRWQELQALLDGMTVHDLDTIAAADQRAADEAERQARAATDQVVARRDVIAQAPSDDGEFVSASSTSGAPLRTAPAGAPAKDATVPLLEAAAARRLLTRRRSELEAAVARERQLGEECSRYQGQVAERERCLPSVAEAEEVSNRAATELHRLRSLDEVLDVTAHYLAEARDKTYTDLAPVLNAALDRWLPEITNGRYQHATVDPQTLEVRVELPSGELRVADRLSVGTAEQVYLLLRIALAEHLATQSTVCPLLLDDVTVQADPIRTEAILTMCKALADDGRQVVLFAQEPTVAAWAEQHLDFSRNSVIRLELAAAA